MTLVMLLAQFENDLLLFKEAFAGDSALPLIGHPLFWTWTIAVIGLLLAGIASWSLVRRDRAAFGPTNRRVCAALDVGFRERRLLRHVGRSAGFTSVAGLLISEGGFDHAVRQYANSRKSTPALSEIRIRVFGHPESAQGFQRIIKPGAFRGRRRIHIP